MVVLAHNRGSVVAGAVGEALHCGDGKTVANHVFPEAANCLLGRFVPVGKDGMAVQDIWRCFT